MNKLTKGIKKKVKGKKKPTQEELEQEELRQYRLEKQREKEEREKEQADKASEGEPKEEEVLEAGGGSPEEKPSAESAEWAKFRELTSGVDSVLSSTKESLQTIKETSYFIRKKVPSEQQAEKKQEKSSAAAVAATASAGDAAATVSNPKWVDVDAEEDSVESEPHPEPAPVEEASKPSTPEKPDPVDVLSEVEKLERAQYFEEDVFNTEYVETVTSGDIGLAVIPDSPTEEGEDPFDTSRVDQVLHIKPGDPKKQKLKAIALGNAVEVLSGGQNILNRAEENNESSESELKRPKRRQRGVYKRPGSVDLLVAEETADDGEEDKHTKDKLTSPTVEQAPPKTLIDEDIEDNGEFKLNLAVTPETWKPQAQPESDTSSKPDVKDSDHYISTLVSEFDSDSVSVREGSNVEILCAKPTDKEDCEFDSLAAESLLRAKDRDEIIGEDDPFDTSAAQNVLGTETVVSTCNFDDEDIKFDADFGESRPPPPQRPPPPVIVTSPEKDQPDYLTSNEHHDHVSLPDPITFSAESTASKSEPAADKGQEEVDPFDTSAADQLCGTEIKLLESELLGASHHTEAVQIVAAFDDFDPRADEEKPESDPFDTSFASGFVQEPTLSAGELLESVSGHDDTPVVLPPAPQPISSVNETEIDPFDTSIADTYSNVEIKVLESELSNTVDPVVSSDISGKLDLSATSAPPPRPPPPAVPVKAEFAVSFAEEEKVSSGASAAPQPELLSLTPVDEDVAPVALLPQRVGDIPQTEIDPFDTSIADKFGSVEVGVLERELLQEAPAPVAKKLADLLPSVTPESTTSPCVKESTSEIPSASEEDRDPFDTTYVDSQVLTELSESDGGRISKPSTLQISGSSTALLASTPEDPNPPLEPCTVAVDPAEEVDPFDTSVADQFGLTELRVLESELIGEVRCSQQPPRPPPPSPRTPAAPAPPKTLQPKKPSVDQLLAASPSTDLPPTLLPTSGSVQTTKDLSPVLLDPFDTSIADQYGTTELKVLEQEFSTGDQGAGALSSLLKRSVSDPDFDPRGDEKVPRPASPPVAGGCLLSVGTSPLCDKVQTLTATVVAPLSVPEPADVDPFDTSFAESLVPGQAELKAIERELLQS